MNIETNRLLITTFNKDMAYDVHINSLDEETRKFVPDEVFETVEIAYDTISYLISCYDKKDEPLVYPVLLKNNKNIGYVQVVPIKDGYEVGYHIAKGYTNQGYATEALKSFLPVMMKHLDIKKVYGICHYENSASQKVLEKCGFILEYIGMQEYHGKQEKIHRYGYTK